MPHFLDFFSAVLGDWVGQMTGAASLVLAVLGFWKRLQRFQRLLFWGVAVVCWVIASAHVWTIEHNKWTIEHNKWLSEVDHNQPQLSGMILGINSHPIPMGVGAKRGSAILLIMEIRNQGADSIASAFEVSVDYMGKRIRGENHFIPEFVKLSGPGYHGQITYYGKDSIDIKTASDPIKRGSRQIGILWAWFPGARIESIDGKTVQVSFEDITRKKCTAAVPDVALTSQPGYFPGLSRRR